MLGVKLLGIYGSLKSTSLVAIVFTNAALSAATFCFSNGSPSTSNKHGAEVEHTVQLGGTVNCPCRTGTWTSPPPCDFGKHALKVSMYCVPFLSNLFALYSLIISLYMCPFPSFQINERSVVGSHSRTGDVTPSVPAESAAQTSTPSIGCATFVAGSTQSSAGLTPARLQKVGYLRNAMDHRNVRTSAICVSDRSGLGYDSTHTARPVTTRTTRTVTTRRIPLRLLLEFYRSYQSVM